MAAPQPPGSTPGRKAHASPSRRHHLLWPAMAAGLGAIMIYNSFGDVADGKVPPPPAAAMAPAMPAPPEEVLGSHAPPPPAPQGDGPAMLRSVPTRLRVPSLAVNAPFTELALGADRRLNPPPPNDSNLVGWFKDGVTPGERGTAIVAGHVDTKTGPAVFLQLQFLKPGSTVDITRADKSVATFKVDSVETFKKAKFPDDRVYGDTPSAQLRLITCGGAYNKKAKDYEDNVVVFAHLDSSKKG
ncbi:class F sortase [Streptomyces sp. NPDC002476]|uniref:class F sortase n=1 Tax=Streptomyces sp. NPDC002476 TaxID=3364648 RepID=UPI0036C7ED62